MKEKPKDIEWIEEAKKNAAIEAVKHVQDGFVVGLGSGSTVAYVIKEISRLIHQKGWKILGVPTSYQAFLLAIDCGICVTSLFEQPRPNLTIDGADQIDADLNMIKGMGGALTQEKIVAFASKQNIIVVDQTKLVRRLGVNQPVPVEVLPLASSIVMSNIRKMGGNPLIREGNGKVGPVVTDNGNFIIDINFGPISNPNELNRELKCISGVIETGLFIKMADVVYMGKQTGVQRFKKH